MKKAFLLLTLAGLGSLWLSGCEANFGQRVKDRITFLQTSTKSGRSVELAQIDEDFEAEVLFERAGGEVVSDTKKLRGWKAVRPDVAKALGLIAPRIALNRNVKVITEDGKLDVLDLGGWYVKPPDPKPEAADEAPKE